MKKEIKEYDEEYLKIIMASDFSKIKKIPVQEEVIDNRQSAAEVPQVTEKKKEKPTSLQKQANPPTANTPNETPDALSYEELFLLRKLSFDRCQCYISADTYRKIKEYFAVIGGKVSMTAYIDNILCHHMAQYKEDINKLYEQKIKKPF